MKKNFLGSLLVLPAVVPLILVIVIPAIYLFYLSFHYYSFGAPIEFVGFENYSELFGNYDFWKSFLNTFWFVLVVVAGQLLIGLAFALLMARGFPFQKLFISLIMMPYAVSPVVAVLIWKYMLQNDIGIINYLLSQLGFGQILWATNPTHAWLVIICVEIWVRLPFTFLIIYSSIISIPTEIFEAAYIDGSGNWKCIYHIIIPIIMPALLVAGMFRFIFSFRTFAVPWLLTQGGPVGSTEILSIYLYREAFRYWSFGSASAIAWAMTIVCFVLSIHYLRIMYKKMFTAG